MRLTPEDRETIVSTIRESISDASLFLFGSRCDDKLKGGDIDLFLTTSRHLDLSDKISLLTKLERAGIQRKVDLIIQSPGHPQEKIRKEVEKKGICLC
ncbi:MAG: nucleotidyltransferase domain-containing protein [Spirochaetales bacterium]|nr:nucleotidyltransferase domain-containing protein [Spirochaetales bacterium]